MGLCASKTVVRGADQQLGDEFKVYRATATGESGHPEPSIATEQLVDVGKHTPASFESEAVQQSTGRNVNTVAQPSGTVSSAMMIYEVRKLHPSFAHHSSVPGHHTQNKMHFQMQVLQTLNAHMT